jgi:hypothetical protein
MPSKPKPKCPACGKPAVKQDNAFFPFCTERCQLIDLGHWLANGYSVPGSLDREGKHADR